MAKRKRTSARSRRSGIVGRAVKAGRRALREAESRVPSDLRRQLERRIANSEKTLRAAIKQVSTQVQRAAKQADVDKALKRLDGISKQVQQVARNVSSRGASPTRRAAGKTRRAAASTKRRAARAAGHRQPPARPRRDELRRGARPRALRRPRARRAQGRHGVAAPRGVLAPAGAGRPACEPSPRRPSPARSRSPWKRESRTPRANRRLELRPGGPLPGGAPPTCSAGR